MLHLPQTPRIESEQEGRPLLHFLADLELPFLLISYLPRASPGSSHSFSSSLMPWSPAWSLSCLHLEYLPEILHFYLWLCWGLSGPF